MNRYQAWGSKEEKNGENKLTECVYVGAASYATAAARAIKKLFGQTRCSQINIYIREIK